MNEKNPAWMNVRPVAGRPPDTRTARAANTNSPHKPLLAETPSLPQSPQCVQNTPEWQGSQGLIQKDFYGTIYDSALQDSVDVPAPAV